MPKLKFTKIQLYLLLMILFLDETSTSNEITQRLFPWENGKVIEDLTEAELIKILEEFISEDIVRNTASKICVSVPNPDAFDLCIRKQIPQLSGYVRELLIGCSSKNYTLLKGFILTYGDEIENVYLAIFSKCLNALFEIIMVDNYNDFIYIIVPLIISPSYYHARLAKYFLLKYVSYIKRNKITLTVIDLPLVFKAWNPFDSNTSGFSITPELSYTEFESIDRFNGRGLAVYIPSGFLNDTTANEKIHFHVTIFLLMISNSWFTMSYGLTSLLAVDIPEMCVNGDEPIIGIADFNAIHEFKLSDLDVYGCATSFCQHEGMLIIDVFHTFSYANTSCPETAISNNYSTIIWARAPVDENLSYFSENLCFNGPFAFPIKSCRTSNITYANVSNQTMCLEEISSNTKKLYQVLRCCRYAQFYCQTDDINVDAMQEYIDVHLIVLLYLTTLHLDLQFDNVPEIVDIGLQHLKTEIPTFCMSVHQCLNLLFIILINHIRESGLVTNYQKRNFVFMWHPSFSNVNFILRKMQFPNTTGYDYQALADQSGYYQTDTNTETIVRISTELTDDDHPLFIGFIIPSHILTRNMAFVCRSKIVIAYLLSADINVLNGSFYIKTIDNSNNPNIFSDDEYSFNVEIKSKHFLLFCISEPKGNVCNDNKNVTIYETILEDLIYKDMSDLAVTSLDILSQLTTSMNPDSKQASAEHRKVFKIITYIGCGLSQIGIFFILTSAAVLEKWFSQRYNITQLSITLALENIFLLLDHKSLKHIGYLIFFYIILAQFTWMLLIGYHQYQKFIKVFNAARLDMKMSLTLGWLTPALILIIPSVLYKECFECNLCYRNQEIFNYFVLVPICCVLIINLLVYIGVIYNVSKDTGAETNPEVKRAKIRALILFLFLLGLSWISILILFMPSVWMSLSGSYVFHIVISSQGFVLFIFSVFLDEHTKKLWRNKWEVLFKKGSKS